jgi:hypothetical protein
MLISIVATAISTLSKIFKDKNLLFDYHFEEVIISEINIIEI